MCTGKCSRFIAVALYPLVVISIICNIVLFFPDGDVTYAKDGHITEEVKYMGGLIGGGVMVSGLFLFFSLLQKLNIFILYICKVEKSCTWCALLLKTRMKAHVCMFTESFKYSTNIRLNIMSYHLLCPSTGVATSIVHSFNW